MSIRPGLRPISRVFPSVGERKTGKTLLIYGLYGTELRIAQHSYVDLIEVLGWTVTVVAVTEDVPALAGYDVVWMAGVHLHGAFSSPELALIQSYVEDEGGNLIVLSDSDAVHDIEPLNQLADIWGCEFEAVVHPAGPINPGAGYSGHALWTDPIPISSLTNYNYYDGYIKTAGSGFSEYANTHHVGIHKEDFDWGQRVMFTGYDSMTLWDLWLVNHLKYLTEINDSFLTDHFLSTSGWTINEDALHNVSIEDDTFLRFAPITNHPSSWSGWSYAEKSLGATLTGAYFLIFKLRYNQNSKTSIEHFIVELLNDSDEVCGSFGIHDSWAGTSGKFRLGGDGGYVYSGQGAVPFTGDHAVSMYRSGDYLYCIPEGNTWDDRIANLKNPTKIKISFMHYLSYWNAADYFDIDWFQLWKL